MDDVSKTVAYSFSQLMATKKKNYKQKIGLDEKETIVNKFICDPEISKDLLNTYKTMSENVNLSAIEKESLFNTFESYFHTLQYSLPQKENLIFYNCLKTLNPNRINQYPSYEYLTKNDPINNFKSIYEKYSVFLKEIKDLNKIKTNLENIQKYIDDMLKVYDVNLKSYYFPPKKEYPVYVYNYYSFAFFKTLEKFRIKKIKKLFKTDKDNKEEHYTESEWIEVNYNIGLFFTEVNKLFEKFNYNNIGNDLKILKILLYYFKCFEYTRDYNSKSGTFKNIIIGLNSEGITSEILKRFKFYTKNDEEINEKNWDSIRINENVYIKYPIKLSVKIKYFNKNILNLEDSTLLIALSEYKFENLNIDGITQNSIVKYSPEIEKYSKKLLKSILSSEKYIDSFLKYDQRFNSYNTIKALLKDIFNGPNSELIFEEIWENIFFIPFFGKDFSGFNSRDQYSIFINCNPELNFNTSTFQKIIPLYHCQLNTLFHEFTHNIALLIAANLEHENFETIIIKDETELNELKQLQNIYYKKYNQNNKIFNCFDDFGDLMEVEMYGIRPRKFKTFSGLFCLNFNSYNLEPNDFREICVGLYNLNICNDNIESSKEKIEDKEKEKYNFEGLLKKLLNSEIAKILCEYFNFEPDLKNEAFIEDGRPRENSLNSLNNEEITIDIDYCDKLD